MLIKLGIKVPYRIVPGGLSVSRSIGDIKAKVKELGGKKGLIIATPEFHKMLCREIKFMIQMSDGVHSNLNNSQIKNFWERNFKLFKNKKISI